MAANPNQADQTGKKRFAFRDVRSDAELLASGRPPKDVKFKKSNPAVKKVSKTNAKATGASALSAIASRALPLAAKAAFGPVGGAVAAQIAGKYGGALLGKLRGTPSTAKKSADNSTMGAVIQEETDPNKIRRPLGATPEKGVSSASASAAGKEMAKTFAKSMLLSVLPSAASASGLPTKERIFKTAASLAISPRFFNPLNRNFTLNASDKSKAEKAVRHVTISTNEARLYPQAGLLEDEIMYRLTLMSENVFAPTKQWNPNVRILEGFRAENSTTSQHERGEAMDITAGGVTENFALAVWMRDHVLYDQLILCHDIVGGSWIHVSFTIENRRRQVLTKTFNDTFVDGLHLYQQSSGTDSVTTNNIQAGDRFIGVMSERQARLQPVDIDTELPQQSSDLLGLIGGGEDECGTPDSTVTDPGIIGLYNPSVHNLTTVRGAGEWVEYVVSQLGPEWGHITKSGGQNQWNGHAVDAIMYKSPTPLYNGKFYQTVDIIVAGPNIADTAPASDAAPQFLLVCSPDDGGRWGGKG